MNQNTNSKNSNAKTAYINATLLDGTKDMRPITGTTVITQGDKIIAVQPPEIRLPDGCEVVDLAGKYLLPGLINLHVHIPASGKPKKKPMDPKKMVNFATKNNFTRKILESIYKSYTKQQLLSGVTTIRTMGGVESYDTWLRDEIAAGRVEGPTILAANMAISVPGGHMAGSLAYEAKSAAQAVEYVEKIAADKPDIIKLMITGGVLDAEKKGEPGKLRMPPEYVKAACDKAHELGFQVAAHVESPEGLKVALQNGVNTIEHGAKPDAECIELFKKTGAAVVTTLSPAIPYAFFDESVSHCGETAKYNGKIVFDGIVDCCRAALENDIPVGLGTDTGCPFITHYDMWRELVYFCRYCGATPAFALYSATLGNAKIAHIDSKTGSIENGKTADFIIVDRNPLDDLTALRNISAVVARGVRIDSPYVKKMPQVERELDKFL